MEKNISSQMTSAETNQNTLQIDCEEKNITLKATLGKLIFDGYKKFITYKRMMKNRLFHY